MSLRAIIVDDNDGFLREACLLLEREGLRVVGVASNGDEAVRCSEERDPDVVLVDVDLGEESGFEVAELLSGASGGRRAVVLISVFPETDFHELLVNSSALGFVSKSQLSGTAVRQVVASGRPGAGARN